MHRTLQEFRSRQYRDCQFAERKTVNTINGDTLPAKRTKPLNFLRRMVTCSVATTEIVLQARQPDVMLLSSEEEASAGRRRVPTDATVVVSTAIGLMAYTALMTFLALLAAGMRL